MDAQLKYLTAYPQRTKCASGNVVDLRRSCRQKKKKVNVQQSTCYYPYIFALHGINQTETIIRINIKAQ